MGAKEEAQDNRREHFLAVLAVVLAGVIQVSSTTGPFGPWNVIIGGVLILVLLTYPIPHNSEPKERVALAATWGFILVSAAGWGLQELYRWAESTWPTLPDFQSNGEAPGEYYLILWLIISTIVFYRIKGT